VIYCCHRLSTKCVMYWCHQVSTQLRLTLSVPNQIPYVIRVTLVAGKLFTHYCATG
jgi:hypothetical protein